MVFSVVALSAIAALLGLGLALAEKKFKVEEDERLPLVMDALPGANCGACGFPGCGGLANEIVAGNARPELCPVGGFETVSAIGEIMGITVEETARMSAFVACAGGESRSVFRYEYFGMRDCNAAMQLVAGGSKDCSYGCLGGGSCIEACPFEAILMEDGIAKIDNEKCKACGLCIKLCPKKIIHLVPHAAKTRVVCSSQNDAKTTRAHCTIGCIGCKMCVRTCQHESVAVEGKLALIDYQKCTLCNDCITKCPPKTIQAI
ncbi:MAG: RnfABCDGE type electron transport complex subunit B [Turicibacter sp.]|nr:RnfABCDGE type electron transport complex subunit B [Turicibacter sp.]